MENETGGVVNITNGDGLYAANGTGIGFNNGSGATFENTGSATSTNTVPFNNLGGIVAASAGTLNFTGGGTDTGGIYNPSNGATINLNDGGTAPTLTGTYSGSGVGTVGLPAGTILIGTGGATFNFPAGLFDWSGGAIATAVSGGALSNTNNLTISGSAAKQMWTTGTNGLVLDNSGTITDTGTNQNWEFANGATVNNLAGGLVKITNGDGLYAANSTGVGFNNEQGATLQNTGPGNITTVALNNAGTVDIESGNVTFSTVSQVSGTELTGGTWIVAGTGTLNLPGSSLNENAASVTLSGSGSFPHITTLANNVGSLSVLNGDTLTTTGNLQSPGSVTVGSGGTLAVTGTITLASSSAVTVEIGGPATSQYGQVNATGADTLAGTLNIVVTGGFSPTSGQQFQIMNFASTGATHFATVNGLTAGQFTVFTLTQNSTNIVLNSATNYASVPPEITAVLVDGSSWSAGFVAALQAANEGNGVGYSIPTGAAQSKPLPWTNINQITIDFSKDVNVQQASLALTGVNVASYSFSGFSYNPITYSATWTLSNPIGDDKLQISVLSSGPSAVTDKAANALDGEWTNGVTSFPSGNGTAGGNFNFNFNVLPGDTNQDGIVNGQDIANIASHWLQTNGLTGDINGDGIVNGQDVAAIASRWFNMLPAGGSGSSNGFTASSGALLVSGNTTTSATSSAPAPLTAPVETSTGTLPSFVDHLAASVGQLDPAKIDAAIDQLLSQASGTTGKNVGTVPRTELAALKSRFADTAGNESINNDLLPMIDDDLLASLASRHHG